MDFNEKDAGQKSNVVRLYKVYFKYFTLKLISNCASEEPGLVMKMMVMGAGNLRLFHCIC